MYFYLISIHIKISPWFTDTDLNNCLSYVNKYFLSSFISFVISSNNSFWFLSNNLFVLSKISVPAINLSYYSSIDILLHTLDFTIAKKDWSESLKLPIDHFSYSFSFLHPISVPSKNTTSNILSTKTLMWSSFFSMKFISISIF